MILKETNDMRKCMRDYAMKQLTDRGRHDIIELLEAAFNYERTPTVTELASVLTGRQDPSFVEWHNSTESFCMRDLMVTKGFVFPAADTIASWANFLSGRRVVDLMCGTGWMSGWLRRSGVTDIRSVDNMSWEFSRYEPWVEKHDAVEFVEGNPADVYIVSWPYMDDTAARVWEAMRPGERMLYVGEDYGGCTGNDRFFDLVSGCAEDVDLGPFHRFWGMHDAPTVYLKK